MTAEEILNILLQKSAFDIEDPLYNVTIVLEKPIDVITNREDRLIGVTKTNFNKLTKTMSFFIGDYRYDDSVGNCIIL